MKNIVLSAVAVLAMSSFAVAGGDIVPVEAAAAPTSPVDGYSIVLRLGMDVEGSQNDAKIVTLDSAGNPCPAGACGKLGLDRDGSWEFSVGIEDNVAESSFGARTMLTYYDHGDGIIHNGGLETHTQNMGIEATYEVFYSLSKYFQPYIGAGAGINKSSVDYQARSTSGGSFLPALTLDRESQNYEPTLHLVVGVSGDIFSGFGYYANYKHRFADTSSTVIPFQQDGVIVDKVVNNDGVDGGQFMVGLNYRF